MIDKYVNTIILGDCQEILLSFPSESIDLVLTSPPYALGLEYERDLFLPRLEILLIQVLKELHRVLKFDGRIILIFADRILEQEPMQPRYLKWITESGFRFECSRVWVKPFSRLSFNHQMYGQGLPFPEWETLWTINKGQPRDVINKKASIRGCVFTQGEGDSGVNKKVHPAGFPEHLVSKLFDIYARPEDIILDPFAGLGTTVRVAKRRGLKAIGIEIEPKYVVIANEMIEEEKYIPQTLQEVFS